MNSSSSLSQPSAAGRRQHPARLLGAPAYHHIRDDEILFLLIYEVVLLLLLCSFLHARGWTLERIGLEPDLKETLAGIGLYAGVEFVALGADFIATILVPELTSAEAELAAAKGSLNPILVAPLSVVNPIFEEGFLCGFMITALRGRTQWISGREHRDPNGLPFLSGPDRRHFHHAVRHHPHLVLSQMGPAMAVDRGSRPWRLHTADAVFAGMICGQGN